MKKIMGLFNSTFWLGFLLCYMISVTLFAWAIYTDVIQKGYGDYVSALEAAEVNQNQKVAKAK